MVEDGPIQDRGDGPHWWRVRCETALSEAEEWDPPVQRDICGKAKQPRSQSGPSHKLCTGRCLPVPIIALRSTQTGETQSQIGRMLQAGQMSSTLISLRLCGEFTPATNPVTVLLLTAKTRRYTHP